MTAIPTLTGPLVGDYVRAFDFDGDKELEGRRACYMEGQITGLKQIEGCWRYKIEVRKSVFSGEARTDFPAIVYPPVNGTPRLFGGVCNGVEVISESR